MAAGNAPQVPQVPHPVTGYALDVVAERIVAGELVRLACTRHLADLETGAARGLRFSEPDADRALQFFGFLRHSKGEWAGTPLHLQPWQVFIIGSVFGWLRESKADYGPMVWLRRFREVYEEVPRKNGKSTKIAGVGLYCLVADGEPGAEVYAAATKRDQAKIIWGEAAAMVAKSPALKKRIASFKGNLSVAATRSKFEPLGADDDTMDGLNISAGLVDELHAHKTRGVVDVLETATGSRRQPLIWYITTAGFNRQSVCYEKHEYGEKILTGAVVDDSVFVFIAAADKGDDWTDPTTWAKANPNLGVSVKLEDLERKCRKAQAMPAAQNAFRRLHLDEWTEQADRWIDMEVWKANAGTVEDEDLAGRACYLGLDLASTQDITAAIALFPPADSDEPYVVLCKFWIPNAGLAERERTSGVPFSQWVRDGLITATDGNLVDYEVIREELREFRERFDVRELPYDRWNATQLITQLQGDGFAVVPFGQGFASMAAPTKELGDLLVGHRLAHRDNPVLTWMASNVAIEQDAAGNMKPSKKKSSEKIDGIVALIMALGRASASTVETDSVYDERDILTV